ncbi:lanthionine synthetase LanC family protein [Streptomyces sp. NPDC056480]|uniref:lanthionine synthetase LanC family protein n=1 Tax=Streptomyces sp. NPDC056480 TaxID=3345833 RepID=UPI0036BA14DD
MSTADRTGEPASRASRASAISAEVAERLAYPPRVINHMMRRDLAHVVLPGCVLLAAQHSVDGASDSCSAVRANLQAAFERLPARPDNLFQGTTGTIGAVLAMRRFDFSDSLVQPIIESGCNWLRHQARKAVNSYPFPKLQRSQAAPPESYEAISGFSGIGRLLLLAAEQGQSSADAELRSILELLTELFTPASGESGISSSLWGESQLPVGTAPRVLATGVAHGLAGPLAFLSLSLIAGRYVDDQPEAVRSLGTYLAALRSVTAHSWPTAAAVRDAVDLPGYIPNHGWCSGSAGIANAIHLAGLALGDSSLIREGIEGLSLLDDIPVEEWGVMGSALCCGYSGVLQAATNAVCRADDPRLNSLVEKAAQAVLNSWDEDSPFGFPRYVDGKRMDTADLLYGASGIALALHDYAHGASSWSSLLLLR